MGTIGNVAGALSGAPPKGAPPPGAAAGAAPAAAGPAPNVVIIDASRSLYGGGGIG